MARRLDRPLLMVYVTSPGVYCEPLTGQVVGLLRDADSLERWLLTELDQAADASGLEVHVRTRRGSPARELASIAAEFSADALVIGAPRHFWHHLIGSVPSWLARNARCRVIVVPNVGALAGVTYRIQDFKISAGYRADFTLRWSGAMEFFLISLLNGVGYGLLLFMLSSGLTLIFSMMGVLNFAHASFYMLGAYVAYTISGIVGFWPALIVAPLLWA